MATDRLRHHDSGQCVQSENDCRRFTSGDVGSLDALGEGIGGFVVDLRSPGFEVWGGVPGSDADLSVSF